MDIIDIITILNMASEITIHIVFIVTAIGCSVFLSPFVEKKRTKYLCGFFCAVLSILLYLVSDDFHAGPAFGLISIIFLVILYLLEKKNIRQKIFLILSFYIIRFLTAGIIAEFSFFTRELLLANEWFQKSIRMELIFFFIDRIVYILVYALILFAGIKLFHVVYHENHEDITNSELLYLSIPLFSIIFVMKIVTSYFTLFNEGIANGSIKENIPADGYRVLFYITAYAMQIIFLLAYQRLKAEQLERRQQELIENQIGQMQFHIRQVESLYEEMKSFRHDMGNHIQVMEQLVENGNRMEAKAYLARLKEEHTNISPQIKTGNAITDIIIREKMKVLEERKIEYDLEFFFPVQKNVDAFDMSIILSNLLDNAAQYVNGEQPMVKVHSKQIEDIYILNISNSFQGTVAINKDTGLPVSSRGTGHGIGLNNVMHVAQKYGGSLVFEQEKKEVIVSVIIPSHPEKSVSQQ